MDALIPSPHLIAFEKLTVSGLEMTIEIKTTRTVVHCPECQRPTQKVHSSYRRRPRDLPTAGLSVRLLLHTRKFFCENTGCSRTIFCERLPECVEKYAHGVEKAFTSPWSNGQTEGQVNRLKYIKRQMFGRAKFDLLKARVLNAI